MTNSHEVNKKIVAFDLDGTLAESKMPLSEDMADLLAKLAAHLKVAVISGGSFEQFKKQFISHWKGDMGNLILLPVDGSQCYEFDSSVNNWNLSDIQEFPKAEKEKTITALNDLIISHKYGIPLESEIYGDYIEDRGTQITFSAYGQHAPLEIKQNWDADQKKRLSIKEELKLMIPNVDMVIGGMTSIDFLPKGFNKAVGLIRLLDRYKLEKNDMLFIGDAVFPGGNDYSSFEAGIESIKISGPKETAQVISDLLSKLGA